MSARVFAYGSNMCLGRFLDYKVHPEPQVVLARLPGYALRFNKSSKGESGRANVEPRDGDTVWGVLYTIPGAELPLLDKGEGKGSARVSIPVITVSGSVDAWVYVARESSVDASLRPFSWYKRFLVEGARSHGLPPEYVATLEATEAIEDPDRERDAERRALHCNSLTEADIAGEP